MPQLFMFLDSYEASKLLDTNVFQLWEWDLGNFGTLSFQCKAHGNFHTMCAILTMTQDMMNSCDFMAKLEPNVGLNYIKLFCAIGMSRITYDMHHIMLAYLDYHSQVTKLQEVK